MYRLFALLIGYALGCVQTAYFAGKVHGIDIREHGSKNAGMTNVTRTVGKKWGAIVFVADILKSVAAFVIATLIFNGEGAFFSAAVCENADCFDYGNCIYYMYGFGFVHNPTGFLPGIYAGLGTVLGHCFPFWLKFRGGKGVSSAIGIIIMISLHISGIILVAAVAGLVATRYISLASLMLSFLAPVLMLLFGFEIEAVAIMAIVGALIWFMHRGNIVRIIKGNERKFLEKKPQA